MNITAYDGWICHQQQYKGKYRNEEGLSGLYQREYKNTKEMIVLYNGHLLRKYKYPKIEIPFRSSMVRWQNLYFCGGFGMQYEDGSRADTNELLIQSVINKEKPIGFVFVNNKDKEMLINKIEKSALTYIVNNSCQEGYYEIGVANHGTIKDNFDINALIESYKLYGEKINFKFITEEIEFSLRSLSEKKLSDFLQDYDYANPSSIIDLIVTGLILGYAVESTMAIIMEWFL